MSLIGHLFPSKVFFKLISILLCLPDVGDKLSPVPIAIIRIVLFAYEI